MRIGIVTQPLNDNYGGILQNWALQQVLKELGHTPITLDAYMKYPRWRYLMSSSLTRISKILNLNRNYPVKSSYGRISSSYTSDFIHENIDLTKPFEEYNRNILIKNDIDALVVGSDQVWRPKYNTNIYDMYLKFAKDFACKKIAYAASFGVDEWEYNEEQTNICRELLKTFTAISVRENSGVDLCRKYFGVDVAVVLDPTMLLSRDRYEELCDDVPCMCKCDYLAVYCLDLDQDIYKLIKRIASKKNLKIQLFSAHGENSLTVPQWLSMFRDAKEVITDSFHGTVFSILFNKKFSVIQNGDRGNSRINTLNKNLNLNLKPNSDNILINDEIDDDRVYNSMINLRTNSYSFIKRALF